MEYFVELRHRAKASIQRDIDDFLVAIGEGGLRAIEA